MRKWMLIFLLLINVIVFFGFAMRGKDAPVRPDIEVAQAFELRLVSEVAQGSLVRAVDQKQQSDDQAWFVEGACILYEGIREQKSADEIAGFMTEQGLSPVILMQAAEMHRLSVVIPERIEMRSAIESWLQTQDISLIAANSNAKEIYQIGGYASLVEAEKARVELLSVFPALQIQKILAVQSPFSIQLVDDIDRNLINKINDMLKLTYETLKIEKKVCKGVASTKPHQ